MLSTSRRRASVVALVLAFLAVGLSPAAPASADPILPINWNVDATTTLRTLGLTVDVTGGSFDGQVDLGTGALSGDLTLPPSTTTFKLGSLPLANATFEMTQAEQITGTVDLANMTATATAVFNIRLRALRPTILPFLNLVGRNCRTASSISVTMSGPISLTGASTFSGTYTVPRFRDCGLLVTPIINLIIPSDGNTFSATFAPPSAA
jgi:hypothetical protein